VCVKYETKDLFLKRKNLYAHFDKGRGLGLA